MRKAFKSSKYKKKTKNKRAKSEWRKVSRHRPRPVAPSATAFKLQYIGVLPWKRQLHWETKSRNARYGRLYFHREDNACRQTTLAVFPPPAKIFPYAVNDHPRCMDLPYVWVLTPLLQSSHRNACTWHQGSVVVQSHVALCQFSRRLTTCGFNLIQFYLILLLCIITTLLYSPLIYEATVVSRKERCCLSSYSVH